ncbi:DUF2442 domain-containing protein [Brevundimonas sp.]|uniref:DUF2442 domain-containing protein n=1 Tax=Brevundimonas sp. TaxID=1871086 RepID=UPI002ABA14EA|nr:DUF2442 domain-containing protein [Brevundimonas sp.]MDZ4362778.1 DUF2442 domain-containing protein [Brevundimonas sp.]
MEITEDTFDAAETQARSVRQAGHAVGVHYDRRSGRVVVDLHTGVQLSFPAKLTEGLSGASHDDLSEIVIEAAGLGLHWPRLDADVYVPGLLQGLLGSKSWMATHLGTMGGRVSSPAKAAAARENGRKGGRPKRAA